MYSYVLSKDNKFKDVELIISLILFRNMIGPSMDPWGTPLVMVFFFKEYLHLCISVYCFRLDK